MRWDGPVDAGHTGCSAGAARAPVTLREPSHPACSLGLGGIVVPSLKHMVLQARDTKGPFRVVVRVGDPLPAWPAVTFRFLMLADTARQAWAAVKCRGGLVRATAGNRPAGVSLWRAIEDGRASRDPFSPVPTRTGNGSGREPYRSRWCGLPPTSRPYRLTGRW
jgi:hypothetical protein